MRPNKAETAVNGCHRPGDMAVRMRKALARPWVGVRVRHLLLLWFLERWPLKWNMKTDFVRRNGQSEHMFCCNPHSVYFSSSYKDWAYTTLQGILDGHWEATTTVLIEIHFSDTGY